MTTRLLLAALLALALATGAAVTATAATPASLPDIEDEVMCPTCNVPLNVAESPQADEQRAFIRGLIAEGRTKPEVIEALRAEYGEDVLAEPDGGGLNASATLVPLGVLAGLVAVLALLLPRWRRRAPVTSGGIASAPALSAADAARVDEDLRRYDP